MEQTQPLINNIISRFSVATEEWICAELNYGEGYISQLRSREKKTGKPQVSLKFFNQLKNFRLQNAMNANDKYFSDPAFLVGKLESKAEVIAEKEARRQEAEETTKYLKAQLAKAQEEKDKLFAALAKAQDVLIEKTKSIESNLNQGVHELKEQIYIASTQLERQRVVLEKGILPAKEQPVPFVKKGTGSRAKREADGHKGKNP